MFASAEFLPATLKTIENMPEENLREIVDSACRSYIVGNIGKVQADDTGFKVCFGITFLHPEAEINGQVDFIIFMNNLLNKAVVKIAGV